jgi:hypothetical protein
LNSRKRLQCHGILVVESIKYQIKRQLKSKLSRRNQYFLRRAPEKVISSLMIATISNRKLLKYYNIPLLLTLRQELSAVKTSLLETLGTLQMMSLATWMKMRVASENHSKLNPLFSTFEHQNCILIRN